MLRTLMALVTLASVTACRGGLLVEPVATSVQRPSQVAVYLSVRAGDAPATDLTAGNFSVSEDGQRLDATTVQLSLLDRHIAADHRTVLLLDTSSFEPGSEAETLTLAAQAFVRKVGATQAVSVYAFDGTGALRPLGAEYGPIEPHATEPGEAAPVEVAAVPAKDQPAPFELESVAAVGADPSRDLHGAVLQGLEALEQSLSRAHKPVRVGTVVVFTRGPDLAGRVSAEQLKERLERSPAAIVVIGLGSDAGSRLERLGRDGVVRSATVSGLETAFEQAADRALAIERSHYLLAYCSPARAGERAVRIDVRAPGEGHETMNGSLRTSFDARGFTPGCDATATPRFVVTLVSGSSGTIPAALPDGVEPPPAKARGDAKHSIDASAPKKSVTPKPRARPARASPPPAPAPRRPEQPSAAPDFEP